MRYILSLLIFCLATTTALSADNDTATQDETYSKSEILEKVEGFFGKGAKNLAKVVEKVFEDNGRPNAYIQGEEAAAALGLGLRYGKGTLNLKTSAPQTLYWQGPSIGIDVGANVAKMFVLIYNLDDVDSMFQRYPGLEGSLYYVGGVGVNYLQSGNTIVAPIRFGAGWRQGISAGYMDFTREASIIPL